MAALHRIAQGMGLVRSTPTPETPSDDGILPPSRSSLTAVDVRASLGIDAVYRSIVILQSAAQQLTVDVWRGPEQLTTDRVPAWITRPDVRDWVSPTDHLAETITSLATRGNAFWRVHRSGYDGTPLSLEVLDPLLVTVNRNERGEVRYHYAEREYTARDIRHLRLLKLPGRLDGLGPIQAAARGLASALRRQGYSDQWFDTSSQPDGVLRTDQNLTAEQAQQYKRQWMESNGPDKGPAVLGRGIEYSPLHLTPAELQWVEATQQTVTSVGRLFGIPARMLLASVEGSAMTYSNLAQDELSFVRHTLMTYLREVEVAISELLPRGTTARFNLDALLRPDTKTRYESHQIALGAGWLTVDEVRGIEGLRPMTPTMKDVTA